MVWGRRSYPFDLSLGRDRRRAFLERLLALPLTAVQAGSGAAAAVQRSHCWREPSLDPSTIPGLDQNQYVGVRH